ncbi:hypothetical protein [Mycobacterium mantenii]|uniref:hypothetical protein n=1 Tax=Mycobacterium mantenii TaxID=560555 RepID=UPI000AC77086|nr:hypothetical protein [Mycobacterium mantenii]
MAIEHGRARCPRCMAWAQYRFLERDADKLEYQVHCDACGNLYSEVTVASTVVTTPAA